MIKYILFIMIWLFHISLMLQLNDFPFQCRFENTCLDMNRLLGAILYTDVM